MQDLLSPLAESALRVSLRRPDSIDASGCLWLAKSEDGPRTQALVAHSIDTRTVRLAIAAKWWAFTQHHPNLALPIVTQFVRHRLEPNKDRPRTIEADEIVLGNGVARLYVSEGVLHITARQIVSRAQRRHRLLGGSIELG